MEPQLPEGSMLWMSECLRVSSPLSEYSQMLRYKTFSSSWGLFIADVRTIS